MQDRRIRLVVLFGGRSAEHDVSCISARHVMAAADPEKYLVEPIGITRGGTWVWAEDAAKALEKCGSVLPERIHAVGPEIDPLLMLTAETTTTDLVASAPHSRSLHGHGEVSSQPPPNTPQSRSRPGHGEVSSQPSHDARQAGPQLGSPTVVLPILHGPMGEDGTVQGLLELAGVAYAGAGVLSSALCMDKTAAKTILQQADVAQVRWRSLTVNNPSATDEELADEIADEIDNTIAELGLPVFVKPARMGSSVGVCRARNRDELADGLRTASRYDRLIIIEEQSTGREIEVAVLGNDEHQPSVPGEIVPGADFYDYSDKYADGAELLVPAPLSNSETTTVKRLAVTACQALRVEGLARVDFFYEDGREGRGNRGWLVNELNTMPGFTPISMFPRLWTTSGLTYAGLIDRLVVLALERQARQELHSRTDPGTTLLQS